MKKSNQEIASHKASKKMLRKKIVITILLGTFAFCSVLYIAVIQKKISFSPQIAKNTWNPTPRWEQVTITNIKSKIENRDDIEIVLHDINKHFSQKNKPSLLLIQPSVVDNQSLLKQFKSNDRNLVVIDIREKREYEKLIRLSNYSNIHYIRFGDLINNNFAPISKDSEIVIVGFTENREIIAASHLHSQGYTNVNILKGGLLQWSLDNLPTKINEYVRTKDKYVQKLGIYSLLKEYTTEEIEQDKQPPIILTFGAYSKNNITLPVMDSKTITNFIHSLPPNKEYILSCDSTKYCWEATYFWYIAKDKISIIGYIRN